MAKRQGASTPKSTVSTTRSKREMPKPKTRLVALPHKEAERNIERLMREQPPYEKDRWFKAIYKAEA